MQKWLHSLSVYTSVHRWSVPQMLLIKVDQLEEENNIGKHDSRHKILMIFVNIDTKCRTGKEHCNRKAVHQLPEVDC